METVYFEDIFFIEFLTDLMLFFCVYVLSIQKVRKWRLVFCAFISATCSLIAPQSIVILYVYKMILLFLISAILTKPFKIKKFLVCAFVLIFTSNITAVSAYNIAKIPIFSTISKEHIHIFVMIVLLLFSLSAKKIVKYLIGKRAVIKYLYDLSFLTFDNKIENVKGYFDSGNRLVTAIGEPIIVIDKEMKTRLNCRATTEQIVITTAAGKKVKTLYDLGDMTVAVNDKKRQYSHIKAIVSTEKLKGFDVILNCETSAE